MSIGTRCAARAMAASSAGAVVLQRRHGAVDRGEDGALSTGWRLPHSRTISRAYVDLAQAA